MRRIVAGLLGAAMLLAGPPAAGAARWSWPVDGHQIVRGFEAPATPYAAGHRGIDLSAEVGATVRSPDDGVVAFAGRIAGRPVLAIDHDGVRSSLEPVEAAVPVGDVVRRGQPVGRLTGGGTHPSGVLHLGARVRAGTGWVYVSPLLYLGGARRAVLLPLSALPG